MPLSPEKIKRLQALSTDAGIIAALAIDQRSSLRRILANAARESISDVQIREFKAAVTSILTPETSAVLLDPEYGLEAAALRAGSCGLLLAYESDGFENPRPHKMLALLPHLSVSRLRELGADGVKILLSYSPFEDAEANEAKHASIERIGAECEALGMPFFLEPVGYDPGGLDPASLEFARRKPQIVIRSMEEFSKADYRVDVLKVEFPVNPVFVEGSVVYGGRCAYTLAEALTYFREADSASSRPYIYLSAGVSAAQFLESLNLAAQAGSHYSGVLCGRATWQDGALMYARAGLPGLTKWLETDGLKNLRLLNDCLRIARPWDERLSLELS